MIASGPYLHSNLQICTVAKMWSNFTNILYTRYLNSIQDLRKLYRKTTKNINKNRKHKTFQNTNEKRSKNILFNWRSIFYWLDFTVEESKAFWGSAIFFLYFLFFSFPTFFVSTTLFSIPFSYHYLWLLLMMLCRTFGFLSISTAFVGDRFVVQRVFLQLLLQLLLLYHTIPTSTTTVHTNYNYTYKQTKPYDRNRLVV